MSDETVNSDGPGMRKRLHVAARSALDRFGVEPAVLALTSNESNCCFRVMPRSGGRFFLKILDPSSCHGADEIRVSMNWQDALASEPGVRIPRVIRTPHGDPFCLVEVDGSPPRICTLEEWMPGRRPGGIPARSLTRRLGEASAILHRHARSYSLPPGSRTRIYRGVFPYSDETFGNVERILLFAPCGDPWLTPEACDVFARASGMVEAVIEALYEGPACPRLIHCDLHPWNTRTFRGTTAILDFEDTLLGHPELDVATSLYYFRHGPDWEDHHKAFREGYSAHLEWPFEGTRQLEALLAGRALLLANFVLGLDGPGSSKLRQTYIPLVESRMKGFIGR